MKLKEIAEKINAHLKRWEADPVINKNTKPDRSGSSDYYDARAWASGARVGIQYIGYQGFSHMSKAEAEEFLSLIEGGYVGKHFHVVGKFSKKQATP